MGRPQLGLPRLRRTTGTTTGLDITSHDTPLCGTLQLESPSRITSLLLGARVLMLFQEKFLDSLVADNLVEN